MIFVYLPVLKKENLGDHPFRYSAEIKSLFQRGRYITIFLNRVLLPRLRRFNRNVNKTTGIECIAQSHLSQVRDL